MKGTTDLCLWPPSGRKTGEILFGVRPILQNKEVSQKCQRKSFVPASRDSSGTQKTFPRRPFGGWWGGAPLFAECEVADGNSVPVRFIFIVVHLKAFGDAQSRARRRLAGEKLAEIIEDVRAAENLPVILGGDFNDRINTDVFSVFGDTPDLFALTADDATTDAISFVGASHRSLIDHIVVSGDAGLGEIMGDDAAIVRLDKSVRDFAEGVSDHVPIVFRMVLRDAPVDLTPAVVGGRVSIPIPPATRALSLEFESETT